MNKSYVCLLSTTAMEFDSTDANPTTNSLLMPQ